jgi:predicted ester cyclase
VWNQQKLEAIDDIFAPTVVFNGQSVARYTFRQVVTARRSAFPDIEVTVEDQVAEGDKVSTRGRGGDASRAVPRCRSNGQEGHAEPDQHCSDCRRENR